MKCVKRPAVIDVVQFKGNFEVIEKFCSGDAEFRDGKLVVATLQGPLYAGPNDFIVKDEFGKFVVCTPKIFYENYDYIIDSCWHNKICDESGVVGVVSESYRPFDGHEYHAPTRTLAKTSEDD